MGKAARQLHEVCGLLHCEVQCLHPLKVPALTQLHRHLVLAETVACSCWEHVSHGCKLKGKVFPPSLPLGGGNINAGSAYCSKESWQRVLWVCSCVGVFLCCGTRVMWVSTYGVICRCLCGWM